MVGALERFPDPLIDPILALLKDGVNADIAAKLATFDPAADDQREAVLYTHRRPFVPGIESGKALPALHCYRVKTREQQTTFVYRDIITTLQFTYCTPSVGHSELDGRWAILDTVWRRIVAILKRGRHPAHAAGASVLTGVVYVDTSKTRKIETFIGDDKPFPGFVAEIDVWWRPAATDVDVAPLHPALSIDTRMFVNTHGVITGDPDVIARAVIGGDWVVDDFGNVVVDDCGRTVVAAVLDDDRRFDIPTDWTLGISP